MLPEEGKPTSQPTIRDLLWGYAISQAIHVAAKLSLFDVLSNGPRTSSEIAHVTMAHEPSLYRLLRALTTVNLLVEEDGKFDLTELGEQLRSDHPQSWYGVALTSGWPINWRVWGDLEQSIMTGKPAFNRVHGVPFFDYFGQHPAEGAVFNGAMTSLSKVDLQAILAAYKFSEFSRVVDVGGGHGTLLRGILERYPHIRGVLFDVPAVVANARALRNSPVESRCEFIGGDMFQSVPAGGDVYILKHILHDWNDDECIQILRNCRKAISNEGKLLHIGEFIKPSNEPDFAKWLDLNMLVQLTGRERNEAEFQALYTAAGFKLTRVITTGGPTIVEGVPA